MLTGGSAGAPGRPALPLGAADRPRHGRPAAPLLDRARRRPRRRPRRLPTSPRTSPSSSPSGATWRSRACPRPDRWGRQPHRDRAPTAGTCRSARTRSSRWAGCRKEGYSNSRLVDGVVLGPLTDIFAMPTWIPVANVFSVGDVLIGVGAAIAVVAAMHGRGPLDDRAHRPSRASRPDRHAARCVRALTRRARLDRYFRRMAPATDGQHGSARSDVRSVMDQPSRANPSRGGDAKPGIFPREDRPVAGGRRRSPRPSRWCREGEPGALHRGSVASGDDGPDPRRRRQVELIRPSLSPVTGRLRPGHVSRWSGLRAAPCRCRPIADGLWYARSMTAAAPRTIVDKIWADHVVTQDPGAPAVLAVDLHLVHEVTSPQAFSGLRARGIGVRRPGQTVATADHSIPTTRPQPADSSTQMAARPGQPARGQLRRVRRSRSTASATRRRASSTSSARSSG